MFDLRTSVQICGLFTSTTMKSAVHLGHEYEQHLIACQNTNIDEIKTLFLRSSEFIYYDVGFLSVDENDTVP